MEILYSTDALGIDLMCVSIESLLKYNDVNQIHIFHDGVAKNRQLEIESRFNCDMTWYVCDIEAEVVSKMSSDTLPPATLYRLFAPDIMFKVNKCIYLDIDTLVLDSLVDLYELNLDGFILAGVPDDGISSSYKKALGLIGTEIYINAGVLLLNLEEMRRLEFGRSVIDLLMKGGLLADDQDCINLLTAQRKIIIPEEWNYTNPRAFKDLFWYGRTFRKAISPKVVHFVGPHKPWYGISANPWNKEWLQHRDKLQGRCSEPMVFKRRRRLIAYYQWLKIRFNSVL